MNPYKSSYFVTSVPVLAVSPQPPGPAGEGATKDVMIGGWGAVGDIFFHKTSVTPSPININQN